MGERLIKIVISSEDSIYDSFGTKLAQLIEETTDSGAEIITETVTVKK